MPTFEVLCRSASSRLLELERALRTNPPVARAVERELVDRIVPELREHEPVIAQAVLENVRELKTSRG